MLQTFKEAGLEPKSLGQSWPQTRRQKDGSHKERGTTSQHITQLALNASWERFVFWTGLFLTSQMTHIHSKQLRAHRGRVGIQNKTRPSQMSTADIRCPYSDLLWCQHAYRSKRWRQQLWIGTCVTSRPQQTVKKCCMLLSYPGRGRSKKCTDWKAVCSLGMWNVLKVPVWPGQPFTLTKSHSLVTLFNLNDIDAVPLHCQWLLLRTTAFKQRMSQTNSLLWQIDFQRHTFAMFYNEMGDLSAHFKAAVCHFHKRNHAFIYIFVTMLRLLTVYYEIAIAS